MKEGWAVESRCHIAPSFFDIISGFFIGEIHNCPKKTSRQVRGPEYEALKEDYCILVYSLLKYTIVKKKEDCHDDRSGETGGCTV